MKTFTAVSAAAALTAGIAQACSTTGNVEVTFYGYPDNSPPGAQVAHNCGGRNYVAGGSGTYADPLTFATAPGEFDPCEILYLPLLKKYVRYEDDCAQCESDWKGGQHHIDIWTGSSTVNGGQKQIDCEDDLTTGGKYSVVRQPPNSLDVDTDPLFSNGNCNKNAVFESNQASCSGGGSSDASGSSNNSTSTDGGNNNGDNGNGKGASSAAVAPASTGFATSATGSPSKTHGSKHNAATATATTTAAAESQSSDAPQDGGDDDGEDGGDDDCDGGDDDEE